MKFIRVGGKAINLAQVTDIAFDGDGVIVFFAGSFDNIPGAPPMTRTLRLEGEAGAALRQWLDRNADDATKPPPVAQTDSIQASLDRRYTTTVGRYQATVWQTKTGHWGARVSRENAVVLQDTFNTLEETWAWCEAHLTALATADRASDD